MKEKGSVLKCGRARELDVIPRLLAVGMVVLIRANP